MGIARESSEQQSIVSKSTLVSGRPLGSLGRWIVVFAGYLAVAFAFHGLGLNVFKDLLGGGDGFTAGYPSKLFATHLSPWNPYVQLGQYSFANTQFQPFYLPALVIMWVFPNAFGYNLFILIHYALAGLFTYLYAKQRALSSYAAALGGLIFMLSGFLSAHKGHQAMMSTAIWLPAMLLFVDRYAITLQIRELASASIVFALSILAGFPQVTVYSMMLVCAYTIFRFRTQLGSGWIRVLRSSAFALCVSGLLALLLSSMQLLAVVEALPQMTREKLTYSAFSENYFPIYHLLTFVFPNFLGGLLQIPTYSSEINVAEVYPYVGLLPLALAFLAYRFLRRQSRDVVFWTAVIMAALVLALGDVTPVHALLFSVPVYNLFRAPARHLLEIDFAISMLAAIALDFVTRPKSAGTRFAQRSLSGATFALTIVFLVVYGLSQVLRSVVAFLDSSGMRAADSSYLNAFITFGAAKSLIERNLAPSFPTLELPWIFLAISILLLRLLRRPKQWVLAAVVVCTALDMYIPYSTLYGKPDTSDLGHPEARPETAFLKNARFDSILYRIYPLDPGVTDTYPLLNMTYDWSTVNDYTPMWLKRYVAMTDFALNGYAPPQNLGHPNVLAAAGAQYFITSSRADIEILQNTQAVQGVAPAQLSAAAFVPDHATALGAGKYRLQSPDGTAVSMLLAKVPLRKATLYQISFDTSAPSGLGKPLLVNLYGPGYDNLAQYKIYAQVPAQKVHQAALIDSGPQPPDQAFVRVYTQSTTPVEIDDLHVTAEVARPGSLPPEKIYQQLYAGAEGIRIFRSSIAQPRFRFVKLLRPCKDVSEARAELEGDPDFDVSADALVEGIPKQLSVASGDLISRNIQNNEMQFTLRSGERSFFVVGDSWFPGWGATIDGKKTTVYVVDGFLRGVMLQGAGIHNLVMSYHPWSVPAGLAITGLGFVLLLLVYRYGGSLTRFRASVAK